MANSYNKIILVGRIGRDAELRATPKGTQVAETSVAVDDLAKKKPEGGFETEWYRIKVWGRQAETLAPMLLKGNLVLVEGRLVDQNCTRTGTSAIATRPRCRPTAWSCSAALAAQRDRGRPANRTRVDELDQAPERHQRGRYSVLTKDRSQKTEVRSQKPEGMPASPRVPTPRF